MSEVRLVADAMVEEMGKRFQTAAKHLAEAQRRYDLAREAYWRARTHLARQTAEEDE